MKQDRLLNTLTALLFLGGLVCIIIIVLRFTNMNIGMDMLTLSDTDCTEVKTLNNYNDKYMQKIIPLQSTVKLYMNYYNCNEVQKGDLALFKYSEHVEPVIRKVVGVPGDQFDLEPRETDIWVLKINGQLFPSENNPFWVKSTGTPPLKTYAETGRSVLREGEYIVLSGESPGLNDSGNYGIVKIDQLVGIAVYDY